MSEGETRRNWEELTFDGRVILVYEVALDELDGQTRLSHTTAAYHHQLVLSKELGRKLASHEAQQERTRTFEAIVCAVYGDRDTGSGRRDGLRCSAWENAAGRALRRANEEAGNERSRAGQQGRGDGDGAQPVWRSRSNWARRGDEMGVGKGRWGRVDGGGRLGLWGGRWESRVKVRAKTMLARLGRRWASPCCDSAVS